MIDVIRKLLSLLSTRERRNAYLLLVMVLVMAFLDVVGIASVMPFMAVLANPSVVETNQVLNKMYTMFNFSDSESFLFFLGVCVFALLVLSIGFKALTTWSLMGFSQMRNFSISRRLVARYLRQPYEWFLSRHSADLGKTVLSEVDVVVRNALMPLMHFLAQGSIVIAVLLLLIVVDPFLALVVGGGIGGAYGVTYLALRRLLERIGKDRLAANQARFKAVSDAFGGIKEVKLGALEDVALVRFGEPALRFAKAQKTALLIGILPRYVLEIVAFGGMLLVLLIQMRSGDGLQSALPVIALYALAGYRLMPALQAAYNHATKLRFAGPALDQLHADFNNTSRSSSTKPGGRTDFFPFEVIRLDEVTYA
ncbi:MAG: ABC transporter transmembrane domain-containing protein, partial [Pseudomonadota bacterium]